MAAGISGVAAAAEPSLLAERIRGEVLLIRSGNAQRLVSETPLRKGDVVRTGREGSVRVVTPLAKTDLAPFTTVTVGDPTFLTLRYGHLRTIAIPAKKPGKRASFQIRTPTSVMGVRGTEFLAHVTRDEKEFGERLAGHLTEPPALAELPKLGSLPGLYSQVCCLDGRIELKPSRSDVVVLHAGDIARIRASVGEFAPTAVGLDEVRSTRQALGFPGE
jgi:hypothetical protein